MGRDRNRATRVTKLNEGDTAYAATVFGLEKGRVPHSGRDGKEDN